MNAGLAAFLGARYAEEDAAGPPSRTGRERRTLLARYLEGAADRREGRGRGEGLLEIAIRLDAARYAQHPDYLAEWAPDASLITAHRQED